MLTDCLVMMEASIGIAIFLEDAATYPKAMSEFAARVSVYIYLASDGPYPIPVHGIGTPTSAIIKYWYGQSTYLASGIHAGNLPRLRAHELRHGLYQPCCGDSAHPGE
jgi:hypothetical protein